jgi:DNA repair exonuclease SbcCD ATPase subunit
MKILQE